MAAHSDKSKKGDEINVMFHDMNDRSNDANEYLYKVKKKVKKDISDNVNRVDSYDYDNNNDHDRYYNINITNNNSSNNNNENDNNNNNNNENIENNDSNNINNIVFETDNMNDNMKMKSKPSTPFVTEVDLKSLGSMTMDSLDESDVTSVMSKLSHVTNTTNMSRRSKQSKLSKIPPRITSRNKSLEYTPHVSDTVKRANIVKKKCNKFSSFSQLDKLLSMDINEIRSLTENDLLKLKARREKRSRSLLQQQSQYQPPQQLNSLQSSQILNQIPDLQHSFPFSPPLKPIKKGTSIHDLVDQSMYSIDNNDSIPENDVSY